MVHKVDLIASKLLLFQSVKILKIKVKQRGERHIVGMLPFISLVSPLTINQSKSHVHSEEDRKKEKLSSLPSYSGFQQPKIQSFFIEFFTKKTSNILPVLGGSLKYFLPIWKPIVWPRLCDHIGRSHAILQPNRTPGG